MTHARPCAPLHAPLHAGLALLAAFALAGCNSVRGPLLTEGTADAAGVAGAGIASSLTKDATVGAGIGLGVQSLALAGLQVVERRVHRAEQDRIAAVAGTLPEGAAAPWSITHDIPIENDEHGSVVVTRMLTARPDAGDAFTCKEIVFSVDVPAKLAPRRSFYTASVCLDGAVWKWATAEPATARWGSLQ